eukprot:CAMPEP_0185749268 /NCGR_PEP_ID=MMETSP1174-20130828/8010_1 /TAXON_ID=35687 /ORGANISM="Dictyocha speculum, Strain CCMP1381" /LENGTH=93 /DNA_ID=CAMNT_0028425321 /DNA_START=162 /DNA_END=439 /DNA_ORIENTATION=+
MTNENEPNSAGQRNNGAAIGTGHMTGLSQVPNTRTEENIRSGAEMDDIGHQIQQLFRIFGRSTDQASGKRIEDQNPDYSREFRFPNLSEGVQR